MKRLLMIVLGMAIGLALAATFGLTMFDRVAKWLGEGPDPQTIAAASLESVREQQKMTVFAARFIAVVTSEQSRFGLSAKKTLILPGLVRYDVDLSKMTPRDLNWNGATRTLTVALPPVSISGPEITLSDMREYDSGGLLMALTNAETRLDAANRRAANASLLRQARETLPMRLANEAAQHAIERSFAMPLHAAGVDARVVVRFRQI